MKTEPKSLRWVGLLSLALACSLFGCSYAYDCEIRGTVTAFPDGAPLEGVEIVLKPYQHDPVTSGPDGSFDMKFHASDINFDDDDTWSLTLSKEGYDERVITIDPPSRPDSGQMVVRIVIAADMKVK